MKKIFNFLKNLLILIYVIIVIFVTICLLSYNDYKVTIFGNTAIIPITDDDLGEKYVLGDLLFVEKNKLSDVNVGDEIFFYKTENGETSIYFANVIDTEKISDTEYTYTVEGNYRLSSSNFIGKTSTSTVIPKVGRFLSIIESKWGFLFIVVFPTLIIFLYTLYSVVLEFKEGEKEEIIKTDKGEDNTKEIVEKEIQENDAKENEIKEDKKETINEKNIETVENTNSNEKKEEETSEDKNEKQIEEKEETPENKNEKQTEEKEETLEEKKEEQIEKKTNVVEETEEQKKRRLIEEKLNSMTEEEKKALIRAKLNSMTEEEKRALLEKKRRQEQNN